MTFYDTCHMTQDVINYANMGIKRTVSSRRIDLGILYQSFLSILHCKMHKIEWPDFSLYFWADSLQPLSKSKARDRACQKNCKCINMGHKSCRFWLYVWRFYSDNKIGMKMQLLFASLLRIVIFLSNLPGTSPVL